MATASREFQVMVKPVGAACNLNCAYCYYLEKAALYPRQSLRMPEALLERYIAQHMAAAPTEAIAFSWHGGEATLLGIDTFRRIVALQHKHRPPGRQILNNLQTNGTLIDEEWCRFLAAAGFQVGLSIDGPRELHDAYRPTKGGRATHAVVMQAYRLLRRHRVPTDVLCVVHRRNVQQPMAVYRFFKAIGVEFLQFLPLVRRQGTSAVSAETVPARAYGEFLCRIFEEWAARDIDRITIQNFHEAERPFLGFEHALCIFRETCGDVVVVERNGDFYCCDHFVDPAHRLGNIGETPLVELLESPAQRAFGEQKKAALPRFCRSCDVLSLCNGGCPKDRFIRAPDGEEGLNYLCAGYQLFFAFSAPQLERMAALRRSDLPVGRAMGRMRAQEALAARRTGRNDPCPCGSGRKYKKCCLGKSTLEGRGFPN
jgi:serine-type anaerobic sulfatase-maturating enzyme